MKFLLVFAFLQFLITQRRANLLPTLSSHLSQSSDHDRRPRDGKSEQMGIRPKTPPPPPNHRTHTHSSHRRRSGCVIPDLARESCLAFARVTLWCEFYDSRRNDSTAFALFCLNYVGLKLLSRTGAAKQDCMTFLLARHYNLSPPATTPRCLPAGRRVDGVQHRRDRSP